MSKRAKIALVFGGKSPEHGISCLTAASVLGAIDRERFDVVAIGISKSGRWTQVPLEEVASLRIVDGVPPEVAEPEHDAVWLVGERGSELATRVGERLLDLHEVDVAFALLHGPYGEDGTIQGMFEMAGVRYVGSGVLASAVGMDKHLMKIAFEAAGLPVGPMSRHRGAVCVVKETSCSARSPSWISRSSSSPPAVVLYRNHPGLRPRSAGCGNHGGTTARSQGDLRAGFRWCPGTGGRGSGRSGYSRRLPGLGRGGDSSSRGRRVLRLRDQILRRQRGGSLCAGRHQSGARW